MTTIILLALLVALGVAKLTSKEKRTSKVQIMQHNTDKQITYPKANDIIWFVDFSNGRVKRGTVTATFYAPGTASFGGMFVTFVEGGWGKYGKETFGTQFFLDQGEAYAALAKSKERDSSSTES